MIQNPDLIQIDNFPVLKGLSWNRPAGSVVEGREALAIYRTCS